MWEYVHVGLLASTGQQVEMNRDMRGCTQSCLSRRPSQNHCRHRSDARAHTRRAANTNTCQDLLIPSATPHPDERVRRGDFGARVHEKEGRVDRPVQGAVKPVVDKLGGACVYQQQLDQPLIVE